MRILKVIHGYPMRYNAGSEVYSQTLCQGLAERHEVHVFTREEDPFASDFRLRTETDPDDARIIVHLVNNPRLKDRYRADGIDERFADVLDKVLPDIIHVGHLNHLSTSLLQNAASRGIPIVYTLHDYWIMCPRSQFIQMFPADETELWAACDAQEDRKCAERCYSRYFSGTPEEIEKDVGYWTDWVSGRMKHTREITELVDLFIAPSRYLHDRYRDAFGLSENKLIYLDYGFDLGRSAGRTRKTEQGFTFGYIGTHIPAKGIHDLIRAFGLLNGDARLRIWGRPREQDTPALKAISADLPNNLATRVEWMPEYRNKDIVTDVFNQVDAIVVPSVWVENSPLVIHEAQQAGVPVITADAGGMGEYVRHEVNGLLFTHRSFQSLAKEMQRFIDDLALATRLGERGYLFSESGDIPAIDAHVADIEALYEKIIDRRNKTQVAHAQSPWRITFDTNPDTCNLKCVMCEEHSPHSQLQLIRKMEGNHHRRMPFELIERIVEETAGRGLREIIPSTMGEPLLYKHFEAILTLCARHKVKLNLTTNGTFQKHGGRGWAKRIVPVTSDVKISWNGACKETHESIMLGSDWEVVLQNVRDFISVRDAYAASGGNRCRVTFQLTFLDTNVSELADIVELAIELGVDRVKGHHLWTHFHEIEGLSMRRSPEAIARWNQSVEATQQVAINKRLQNGDTILLENIFPLNANASVESTQDGVCPFLGQEAWVSAQGRFDPCCAPNVQRRTLGEFGNLNDHSLMEIWRGDKYRSLVSSYRNRSLCMSCNMTKPSKVA